MNKSKSWVITIFLILLLKTSYCQKSDYIATDSTISYSIKLIEGSSNDNAKFIRLYINNNKIEYSPNQLTEYGFKNGTVYISKSIISSGNTNNVFLERLEYGKITLYYYSEKGIKTFFLERDSAILVEINNNDFRKRIAEFTSDFDWKVEQVQLVKYSRRSISKLISLYNNRDNKPLSFPRFGVLSGYNRESLTESPNISTEHQFSISFTPSSSVSFGVFTDLPIEMGNFSFNVGVNFSKSGFSVNSRNHHSDIDVVVNITSANIPLLIRYTIPSLVWRPFINAGSIYSYHLVNDSEIYESSIDQNVITINEVFKASLISEGMLGYSLGLGLQRNLDYKKIASLELRFNKLYGNEHTFNKSQLEILIGFSF